jgi:isochorismate synthase
MSACEELVDQYLKINRNIVLFRLPGEQQIHCLWQDSGTPALLYHPTALNKRKGFVIAPFHVSPELPIVLMEPDHAEVLTFLAHDADVDTPAVAPLSPDDDYRARFTTFMEAITTKRFEKLVLSRSLTIQKEFSVARAFLRACAGYAHSCVYLCQTAQTGVWTGSTPEMLLAGNQTRWHTMALAGTQAIRGEKLPEQWDNKNLEEQMLVSAYIRENLKSFGIQAIEKKPYTVRAGEIAHLRSDFDFNLPNKGHIGSLLQLLHPTPATCGLPKAEALDFILRNEGYNRQYYSGFIGRLDPEGRSDLYVNLRCMHITAQTCTCYAGGGLLPTSTLAAEWQETEDKMKTMLRVIMGKDTMF